MGVLDEAKTSRRIPKIRYRLPALRDGWQPSFRDKRLVMFGGGLARPEVSTEGFADDLRSSGVIVRCPVVDCLAQLRFEPDGERVGGTRSHRWAPGTSPQLGDVEPGLGLLGQPLQDLVGQLNTCLGPSVGLLSTRATKNCSTGSSDGSTVSNRKCKTSRNECQGAPGPGHPPGRNSLGHREFLRTKFGGTRRTPRWVKDLTMPGHSYRCTWRLNALVLQGHRPGGFRNHASPTRPAGGSGRSSAPTPNSPQVR